MTRTLARTAVTLAFAVGTGGAWAQQCEGFGDVLATDSTCPAIEWIKNRGVTLGCVTAPGPGPNYCPLDNVRRDQMALFMQRLGKSLTTEVHKDHVTLGGTGTPITIPGEPPATPLIACEMAGDSTVADYPRQALLNATVTGLAVGNSVAWRAYWIYSTDGGATYGPIMDGANSISSPRASSTVDQWSGVSLAYALDLPALLPLQVKIAVRRDNVLVGTTGNFANVRCQMTVSIVNANGSTSPL